ncbi:MAG: hypothetical protein V3U03_11435 [Myxococcota bacterium]
MANAGPPPAAALHAAVVFTLSPTGLAVARSLGPRGVAVTGVDPHRLEIGHYSRWVRHERGISHLPPGPELLEGLLRFGQRQERPPVLFLGGDPYIDFLARNHQVLREHFILPDSMRPEINSVLADKPGLYERCQSLGVAMPATFAPTDPSEAAAAAAALRYPAVVKPSVAYRVRRELKGAKLVQVRDASEALSWWTRIAAWSGGAVLQEVVEGPESNIFVAGLYSDAEDTCRALFTACKNRQYPPWFGSGSYMEARWSDEIANLSLDLIRKLGFRGIAGTEFKWDPRDETWKLIEVNPRPTLWFALTRAAGVDVVWDAYCDLIGRPNPVHVNCQDDTMRWQLLVRDLVSGLHFLRTGELGWREFLRTVVDPRKKEYAILSLRDAGTTLAYPMNTLWKYRENLRGG